MYLIYIALAAFFGGLASSALGWLGSGEAWNGRKFFSSFIRSLIAGAVFAVGYSVQPVIVGTLGILAAFLAGAGVDVLGNRLAGSITASQPGNLSPPKT
jgi:hypothetical protein